MTDRHGWNSWQDYFHAHQNRLDSFEHFILSNTITIAISDIVISFSGVLHCCGGLEIHVQKTLEVRQVSGRPQVRTRKYSYHVQQRVEAAGSTRIRHLFRFDNAHDHPGHPDAHHRHQYQDNGIEERMPVQHTGVEGWPTLSEVIEEAYQWWLIWCSGAAHPDEV